MRVTFAPEDRTQAAVVPQQIELRRARPKRYPIGRWLLAILLLVAAAAATWWWLAGTRIYSYGVVETGFEVFHAPVRSRVSSASRVSGMCAMGSPIFCAPRRAVAMGGPNMPVPGAFRWKSLPASFA